MPIVTYLTSPRTNITAPDPLGSALPTIRCVGAMGISIGGACSTPNSSITYRVISLDITGQIVLGVSGPYTLQTGLTPDWSATEWLGTQTEGGDGVLHLAASQIVIKVDAITPAPSGTPPVGPVWQLGWQLLLPAGVTPPQP
jgi:hypothetical protein